MKKSGRIQTLQLLKYTVYTGVAVLAVMYIVLALIWSNHLPYRFRWYAKIVIKTGVWLVLLDFAILFIISVCDFCRWQWQRGMKLVAGGVIMQIFSLFALGGAVLFDYIGPAKDHFADKLKLPENVALIIPDEDKSIIDFRSAPAGSFQRRILASVKNGRRLKDDEKISLPALEKLMESPVKRKKLYQYLASSPDWRLYSDSRGGLHAVRRFVDHSGTPVASADGYYSFYGRKPDDRYSFRLDIGLEGLSWNGRLAREGAEIEPSHRRKSMTRFFAGDALVEIIEECGQSGRPMTASTVAWLQQEFSKLELKSPDKSKKPGVVLRGGKGVYTADIYCNPGEAGKIYLKAFEVTEEIPLSAYRLKHYANERTGFSEDSAEMFFGQIKFNIYEGDWGEFYGVRLEVHFVPDDSDKPERKLLEGFFQIEGWMRSPAQITP